VTPAEQRRAHAELCGGENREAGPLQGRFRRSRSLREGGGGRARRVALAVELAKQGDAEALRYLYVEYADNVYGYVASLVRDEHEAEDVTQQVFAKLLVVLPRYELRDVPFSAWILRVAHNAAMDTIRQRRAIPHASPREQETISDDDRSLVFREALDTLPENQRTVVVLRHVVGLSPPEIARRLGRTERSVHGLHHRGRGALKAELLERGAGPAVAAA
jgi:RNA polymerase sigma-70 factor, ECF subfamily